jgi:predicted P-loop ATPase
LAGLKKVEVETVKSFISCQNDNFREAYAKRATPHPRQCVFFGTTNNQDGFLRDPTGNRRFWVIDTPGGGTIKPWELTDEYISQVWAEACHYYRQSESLILPPELDAITEQAQRTAMEPDDRTGIVREFLELLLPPEKEWHELDGWRRHEYCRESAESPRRRGSRRRDFVPNIEIWVECLGKRREDILPKDSYAIASIMKQIFGWEKADKRVEL